MSQKLHDDIAAVRAKLSSYPLHTRERWERILAACEEMEKALEFYADTSNWRSMTDGFRQLICMHNESDLDNSKHPDYPTIQTGGRIARETLRKVGAIGGLK